MPPLKGIQNLTGVNKMILSMHATTDRNSEFDMIPDKFVYLSTVNRTRTKMIVLWRPIAEKILSLSFRWLMGRFNPYRSHLPLRYSVLIPFKISRATGHIPQSQQACYVCVENFIINSLPNTSRRRINVKISDWVCYHDHNLTCCQIQTIRIS